MPISFDTMVAAHVLNENLPVNLQDVGSRELGVVNWGKGVIDFGLNAKKPPTELWGETGMGYYCARDSAYAHLLFKKQVPKIREQPEVYNLIRQLILPGLNGFLQVELNGIFIDRERLEERKPVLEARRDALEQELLEGMREPFRSTVPTTGKKKWYENDNFIRKWFYGYPPDGLGLTPVKYTDSKTNPQPSVDKNSLGHYKTHPTVATYLKLNDINTQLRFFTQWLDYVDDDDRLHPQFNLTGTVTGRRSCSEPNLMQVPKDPFIRSVVGAPKGWKFLEFDYSQIEVRLAAWFAREDTMIEVFSRPNGDIYRHTAAAILGKPESEITKQERNKAKPVVLGFLYGMSAGGFKEYAYNTYEVEFTDEECVEIRQIFFRTYPRLVKWHEECKHIAQRKFKIHSILGRTRHLMNVLSTENFERWKAGAQAINSPVQGTGGDLLLMAVGTLSQEIDMEEVRLVGDIHDALLVQVKEEVWEKWAAHILDRLEHPPGLAKFGIESPLPLKAECKVGTHWNDPEAIEWRPE